MGKKVTGNLKMVIGPILTSTKRVVLKLLRTGGVGFKLFGLPAKRIAVADTKKFFKDRVKNGYDYINYGKKDLTLEPAINTRGLDIPEARKYTYEHFMVSLPMGAYYHKHPSVITSDGCQLAIASNHPELSQEEHVLFQEISLPRPETFKGCGLVLSTANDNNYYHCLFQIPPKKWLLEKHGLDLEEIDWYLLESSNSSFQDEIITSLGIDKSRIRDLKKHPHVRGERLLALPAFWKPEPWICDGLREVFLEEPGNEYASTQRLYISRNKASYRRILNEPALLEVLNRYGFRILQLEGLSIKEQARIFHSAEMIVSAHGAALANTVFCKESTMVIEFRHADHYSDLGGVYEHLSSICGLNHFTYLCEGEAVNPGDGKKFYDLRIDLESVERLLAGVFENEDVAL